MKDAAIIALSVLCAWALLSWATAPNAVQAERDKTQAVEAKLAQHQTQVAFLLARPTPTRVVCYAPAGHC